MAPVISTLFFLGILVPLATALSFDFPTFEQSSLDNILLQGHASWSVCSNGCIQLTRNQQDASTTASVGRAVYKESLLLWNDDADNLTDFSTHFTFIINSIDPSQPPADGMTFFLSPYFSGLRHCAYCGGCGLGLFDGTSDCPPRNYSAPIVAVEFDMFPNPDVDPPSGPHVGIDIGSPRSVVNKTWEDDNSSGSSTLWQGDAWVSYDSGTRNLSVFLTVEHRDRSTNYNLSYIVDLRKVINSSKAAVGFTASTGKWGEIHELLSWNFSSTLEEAHAPTPIVPILGQPGPMHVPMPVPSAVRHKSKTGLIVGTATGVGTLFVLLGFVFLWRRKKRTSVREFEDNDDDSEIQGRAKRFSYEELAAATRNFSEDVKLGEGGFGSVYKGHLRSLNLDVAIKKKCEIVTLAAPPGRPHSHR